MKIFKKYVELCKSYVSSNMILNVNIAVKIIQIWMQNGTQMVPQCSPNAPPKASKWARRPQDGSRGAKLVSMRLQELPKASQDGSYGPQHDP